jgi:hypothetical protein
MKSILLPGISSVFLLLGAIGASAQVSLTVNDFSFETPALPSGQYTGYNSSNGNSLGSWDASTSTGTGASQYAGVQNVAGVSGFYSSGLTGSQMAFNDTIGFIYQPLTYTVAPGTYTLDVDLGWRASAPSDNGSTIGLYVGTTASSVGTALGEDSVSGTSLTKGAFINEELTVSVAATSPLIGDTLVIGLSGHSSSYNADFDNVRLSYKAVPEGSTWIMLFAGGLLLALVARRSLVRV